MNLVEFTKLAPLLTGQSSDPVVAENWIVDVEKAFALGQTTEESKLPLAEFQLKEKAHDW